MNKHFSKVIGLLFLGLLIIGCEEDSIEVISSITEDESVAVADLDNTSSDVEQIVELLIDDVSNEVMIPVVKKAVSGSDNDCREVTKTDTDTGHMVTVNFGEACTLPNEKVLSGVITYTFDKDVDIKAAVITCTFSNFYIDGIKVDGGHILTRGKNSDDLPESTIVIDHEITFKDGASATHKGTKTRVFTEGKDTKEDKKDNTFSITGSWASVFKDGGTFSSEVKSPLIRKGNCHFFLSGTIEVTKNGKTGTLDYGDGTCDNKAIFTNELEEEKEITLGKNK